MAQAGKNKLSIYILIAAALGIATGLLIGERAAILHPIGIAYAKMLEIAVFPYLICSLFVGLGGLARARARRLFQASWGVYLVVWGLTFLTIFLLGMVIPSAPAPSLLTAETTPDFTGIIDQLIPANITVALEGNFVPAIVVFAVLYSIAVQVLPQKITLLESMEVLRKASITIWNWVVYFAPPGVFALFASTAGTVDGGGAGGLAIYTGLFLFGTFVLGFLILPLLLSWLVPQSYGSILSELRPALILALVTTLSVAALPFIQKAAEALAKRENVQGEEASDVIHATLSIAYVLSQLGNYFIALFLIYASYHDRVVLTLAQWVLLPFVTLLSGTGSPSASVEAVAFLAQWLQLPAGTSDLYIETMTITRYGQVALSVMGFAFVTLVVTMIYFGRVRLRPQPLLGAFALTTIVFATFALGAHIYAAHFFPAPSDKAILARTLEPALKAEVPVILHRERPADLSSLPDAATFKGIHTRAHLRIGYARDVVPFSYFNSNGDLVGYDIAAAYRLARDLHVGIEFIPIDWTLVEDDLIARRYDIVMAGAYATPERLRQLSASDFYIVSPVALITRASKASQFLSYDAVAARRDLHLAVFRDPVLEPLARRLFPKALLSVLDSYDELPDIEHLDAAIWTREQAAAWTSARSGFTAVAPHGIGAPLPISYFMPPASPDMLRYVNLWLQLEQNNGARESEMDYWVRGLPRPNSDQRWNLLDNVLIPLYDGAKDTH